MSCFCSVGVDLCQCRGLIYSKLFPTLFVLQLLVCLRRAAERGGGGEGERGSEVGWSGGFSPGMCVRALEPGAPHRHTRVRAQPATGLEVQEEEEAGKRWSGE